MAIREVKAMVPVRVQVIAQPGGDLGERMRGVLANLFTAGARRVALIGSDLPEITAVPVAAAFAALEDEPARLVLGPSLDGGYYLIAATTLPPVFEGISWGRATVLQDTMAAAKKAGLRVHLLPPVADVDTSDDLQRAAVSGLAPRTTRWVRIQSGLRPKLVNRLRGSRKTRPDDT
jgi:hypothetical protein